MKALARFLVTSPRGTQSALARLLQVNDSTVLRWASGKLPVSDEDAARLRQAMAVEARVQYWRDSGFKKRTKHGSRKKSFVRKP